MVSWQRLRPVLAAGLMVASFGPELRAQTKPIWRETLETKIESFTSTPFGTVVVQLKEGVFAADVENGKRVWSRPDVDEFGTVSGTPFAIFTSAAGLSVADLESGKDKWSFATLGFMEVKGRIHVPEAGLLFVYGETADSLHTLIAARYESGEVVWRQPSLYTDPQLATKARKMKYGMTLLDTETTVILDPADDGLIRLDLQTGKVLWRISEAALDSKDDNVDLFARDGRILVAHKKKLLAINQSDGKILWSRKIDFPTPVFQLTSTPQGLLVRGAYNLDGQGRASWRPYLTLLDPATGSTKWINEKDAFKGRSSFLLERDAAVVALEEGVATYNVATGALVNTIQMPEFQGGESACCIERLDEGQLLIWSSQNLRMFDRSGTPVYSKYFKAPGASFLAKLAVVAAAAAASGAGAAAAGPGGFYNVYTPNVNSSVFQKFKASADLQNYRYVFTEEEGTDPARFALVRLHRLTGKEDGRLKFTDRSPAYRLDPTTGIVVVADDATLLAFRFDSADIAPAPSSRSETPAPSTVTTTRSAEPAPAVSSTAPSAPAARPAAAPPVAAPLAPTVATPPSPTVATPPTPTVAKPAAPAEAPRSTAGATDPAAARTALDAGTRAESAKDWKTALQHYERARSLDPSMAVFIDASITRVREQMGGTTQSDALRRARQDDALGRRADAMTWYERALETLPESDPNRDVVKKRLSELKGAQ